jgi:hypothetical protein
MEIQDMISNLIPTVLRLFFNLMKKLRCNKEKQRDILKNSHDHI